MKAFKVEIEETLSDVIEVMAESEEEAISKIRLMYFSEEIVLSNSNHVSTEFEIFDE